MRTFAADAILVVHFVFVLFVVAGLAAIWLGAALRWRWMRNFWFRVTHLVAIFIVAAEGVMGVVCPLTLWEDALRGSGSEVGFIARWVRSMMFYEFPEWVFTLAYVLFALIVLGTYWLLPPQKPEQE